MKERKRLYDIAKKTKSIEAWKSYQRLRNRITKEIEIAHTDYQSQLFTDDSNNTSKRFWKYIKSLRKDHIGVPTLINNGKVNLLILFAFSLTLILINHLVQTQ